MLDSAAVATGMYMGGINILSLVPFVGPIGLVILILAWFFRDEIKVFLTSRASERKTILEDVQTVKNNLSVHTDKEEAYWAETEKRLNKLEMESETSKVIQASNHSETLRILGQQNERLSDLADSVKVLTRHLLR